MNQIKNNLKKALIVVALGLAIACSNQKKNITSTQGISNDSTLLFEVSHPDMEKSSFLFGTIHLIPAEKFTMWPALKETASKVDKHVYEINKDDLAGAAAMAKSMLNGKPWTEFFSQDSVAIIKAYIKENIKLNLFENMALDRLPPFQAAQIFMMKGFGENPKTYELELAKIADSLSIPFDGLETVEEQLALLENISDKDAVSSFRSAVFEHEKMREVMTTLISSYQNTDLVALDTLMASMDEMSVEMSENLLKKRNEKWIPAMEEMMKKEVCLFAVGAGHLGGKDGVINLLKAKGYTVKGIALK